MSSNSSKCLPFNISFILGNRKESLGARSGQQAGCSNTVICLVAKIFVALIHFRGDTPKHTQTVIDATQKPTAIDQQQHNCETLICQRHQTMLRLLSSAATASTQWRVYELNCPTTYSLHFYYNNVCTNVPHCYDICTVH